MNMPRVAVIMPAYNAAATIVASLASARRQTLADIEIIVVDDGSTDETAALVMAAAREDGRIRLIEQTNGGPMAARNRAIAATTAPRLAPLDADDLWHPDYLAALLAAMDVPARPGFAYALRHVIDMADRILFTPPTPHISGRGYYRHLLVNFVGCGSGAVFRRDALEAAGGYDEATRLWGGGEDYLLQLRIAARHPIACVPRRLVGYRRRPGSVSDDPRRMADARRRVIRAIARELGPPLLPVPRWVCADADRTAAALLAARGRWASAMPLAVRALACDPAATVADFGRRAGNACRRALAATGSYPHSPSPFGEELNLFVMADSAPEAPGEIGPPLGGRLRRLATLDEAAR